MTALHGALPVLRHTDRHLRLGLPPRPIGQRMRLLRSGTGPARRPRTTDGTCQALPAGSCSPLLRHVLPADDTMPVGVRQSRPMQSQGEIPQRKFQPRGVRAVVQTCAEDAPKVDTIQGTISPVHMVAYCWPMVCEKAGGGRIGRSDASIGIYECGRQRQSEKSRAFEGVRHCRGICAGRDHRHGRRVHSPIQQCQQRGTGGRSPRRSRQPRRNGTEPAADKTEITSGTSR
jgi:hypothetical protein